MGVCVRARACAAPQTPGPPTPAVVSTESWPRHPVATQAEPRSWGPPPRTLNPFLARNSQSHDLATLRGRRRMPARRPLRTRGCRALLASQHLLPAHLAGSSHYLPPPPSPAGPRSQRLGSLGASGLVVSGESAWHREPRWLPPRGGRPGMPARDARARAEGVGGGPLPAEPALPGGDYELGTSSPGQGLRLGVWRAGGGVVGAQDEGQGRCPAQLRAAHRAPPAPPGWSDFWPKPWAPCTGHSALGPAGMSRFSSEPTPGMGSPSRVRPGYQQISSRRGYGSDLGEREEGLAASPTPTSISKGENAPSTSPFNIYIQAGNKWKLIVLDIFF